MIIELSDDEVRALAYAEKIMTIFDKSIGVIKSSNNAEETAAESSHCAVTLCYLNDRINKIKEERKKI